MSTKATPAHWLKWGYAAVGLAVLLLTTAWSAWHGAQIEYHNADQLSDAFLFENHQVFAQALFPGAHSFLLKWPLFWLLRLLHFTPAAFSAVTISLSLLTVAVIAAVLSRIERRPAVLANWYLALASALWLVPAQLQPGNLLPANMAMITTRNLEYAVYLLALVLTLRARQWRQWSTWLAGVLLTLVFASDKLFLVVSVLSGLLGWSIYTITRRRQLQRLFAKWLLLSGSAAVAATLSLWLITHSGLTHIVGGNTAGPYQAGHGWHTLALGVVYAILGVATNFGANPAFDTSILADWPRAVLQRLISLGGLSFIINFGILVSLLTLTWRLVRQTFRVPAKAVPLASSAALSLLLVWNGGALLALFVVTNHYYAGDTRYLTLLVLTLFIAGASYVRQVHLRLSNLVMFSLLCIISLAAAVPLVITTWHNQNAAYNSVDHRNQIIQQVLQQHHSSVLVGDYWRVLPIKAANQVQAILPLENCTTPRAVLTSTAWNVDLQHRSFAYLLSQDRSLTDFPSCSLDTVTKAYGHPNASVIVSGSVTNPTELLLFYDQGIHHPTRKRPTAPAPSAGSLTPQTLDRIRNPGCTSETIMNVVAHQDDDLLFMNPDELHDIRDGHCIRTVYITAGDAGSDKFYWLSREQGSEAAYNYMTQKPDNIWEERTVKLADGAFASIATPRGLMNQSLIFLHLPDGNVDGSGFAASHYESLAKLEAGSIGSIQTIDGQSSYTEASLTKALTDLMIFYHPQEVRTQANYVSPQYPDHSDHMAVGRLTKQAYAGYVDSLKLNEPTPPIKYYLGYPIHALEPNVGGDDLGEKQTAFFQYARFDGGVCHNIEQCNNGPVYGLYLQRQYQNDN